MRLNAIGSHFRKTRIKVAFKYNAKTTHLKLQIPFNKSNLSSVSRETGRQRRSGRASPNNNDIGERSQISRGLWRVRLRAKGARTMTQRCSFFTRYRICALLASSFLRVVNRGSHRVGETTDRTSRESSRACSQEPEGQRRVEKPLRWERR